MYRAKERGRARYEVFDEEMRSRATQRLEIVNAQGFFFAEPSRVGSR